MSVWQAQLLTAGVTVWHSLSTHSCLKAWSDSIDGWSESEYSVSEKVSILPALLRLLGLPSDSLR